MFQDTGTFALLEKLHSQSGFQALWQTFREHMEAYFGFGTGYYGVLVLPNHEESRFLPQMHNYCDFPEDYLNYVQYEKPLWEADPILPHCLTTGEPVSWRDLQSKTLEHEHGRELLAVNHDLGLHNGFAVPVEGRNKKSMIGLHAPNVSDREFDLLLRAHAREVTECFKLIHHAIEADEERYAPLVGLTPREEECLLWSAAGLSSKRIAFKLSLSHRTVENCLFRAQRKLKAANKSHAVYKAVVLGLIQP